MQKIVEILGIPTKEHWPLLASMPEYTQLPSLSTGNHRVSSPQGLDKWYWSTLQQYKYPSSPPNMTPGSEGLALLRGLLEYDPTKRLTAEQALKHTYFLADGDKPAENCFEKSGMDYPLRRVSQEDNDIRTSSLPGTKRSGLPDDSYLGRPAKRLKEG